MMIFVFIFTMYGHWSPRKARAEYAEHQARIAAETARLQQAPATPLAD